MVHIRIEPPDQPEAIALIDALDAYQRPLYPAESHHGIDIDALRQPNVVYALARTAEGEAVGCGAVVVEGSWAELKRMFVPPPHRGRGIAQALLSFLEAEAMHRGVEWLRLETGFLQPEALRLYERAGFVRRGPFGDYDDDPHSVFMEKRLAVH
ncbi:MAG TPA: GNAT family N-acetyltransferase [Ramlibacter sp.]|nr:GNAT family N-acetyltransferase [Ramlibacter sp.]